MLFPPQRWPSLLCLPFGLLRAWPRPVTWTNRCWREDVVGRWPKLQLLIPCSAPVHSLLCIRPALLTLFITYSFLSSSTFHGPNLLHLLPLPRRFLFTTFLHPCPLPVLVCYPPFVFPAVSVSLSYKIFSRLLFTTFCLYTYTPTTFCFSLFARVSTFRWLYFCRPVTFFTCDCHLFLVTFSSQA